MVTKIGVNGFGRIGRLVIKAGITNKNLEFVAINDLTDPKTLAHLFKYDSTFGIYPGKVEAKERYKTWLELPVESWSDARKSYVPTQVTQLTSEKIAEEAPVGELSDSNLSKGV